MTSLDEIYEEIRCDPFWDHLRLPGIRLVPGFGPERPKVIVVGEAPGATENTRGRPFCGAAGVALGQLMDYVGLRTEDQESGPANTFLTNVVKYRPPGNRTPKLYEIEHGRIALRQEWAALGRPSVLVAAGGPARTALTPKGSASLGAGHPMIVGPLTVWIMYHPAYPLRQRRLRPIVEKHWERFGEWLRSNGHVE